MTEKFFDGLNSEAVPIVMSGADYSLFAPGQSFIDTKEFDGPAALGYS